MKRETKILFLKAKKDIRRTNNIKTNKTRHRKIAIKFFDDAEKTNNQRMQYNREIQNSNEWVEKVIHCELANAWIFFIQTNGICKIKFRMCFEKHK